MSRDMIQKMVDAYMQAELDVLSGKTITFRGRTMTSENLTEIIKGRREWEARLNATQGHSRFAPKQAMFP
ncbi:hypothetical protein [Photobacterium leiognathi]|uniref:hypothetical protein n=1 Tax=Photobacterium leiognathi TaxID=553611 RepID=UPI0027398E34|nr:hypothetical protein [Photobacterium leiognathi]